MSDASSWVTGKVFEIDGGTEAPAMRVPAPVLTPSPREPRRLLTTALGTDRGQPPGRESRHRVRASVARPAGTSQPWTEFTQDWATAAGCSCCEVTSRFSFEIALVVSLASMLLSTFATPEVSTDFRMTGTM